MTRQLDALVDGIGLINKQWDESRCRVCGWPLADSVENGCVDGNCSMRPVPKRRLSDPLFYSTDHNVMAMVIDYLHTMKPNDPLRKKLGIRPYDWISVNLTGCDYQDWICEINHHWHDEPISNCREIGVSGVKDNMLSAAMAFAVAFCRACKVSEDEIKQALDQGGK